MVRWIFPNTHIPRSLTMPDTTLLEIPEGEQAQRLAALRRARYGYLLALHVVLLCAAATHRRRLPSCYAVHAPVCPASSASITLSNGASPLTGTANWPSPSALPS